ncbi:MAG: tyrosine/phenylalanine carboxypeptidase domain-containing protein [Myxococcota bacterium]
MARFADEIEELSDALVTSARKVKVLSALSWPQSAADQFLDSWRKGAPEAPPPRENTPSTKRAQEALREVAARCDEAHPVGAYLAATATSYRRVAELIDHVRTPTFHAISREVYGGADGSLRGSSLCHRDAAEQLLAATDAMAETTKTSEGDYCLPAEVVARDLETRWAGFFAEPMRFVVDADLSAKAAASSRRVRLRSGTCFSEQDINQLSAHEIGVHSLTARNGRAQPKLRALSLGAPRTTATQEGIATFAELVTGAIDLARLRRIALRIRAIGLAEDGANFVELFTHLVEAGETPSEAVRSTMRIFRGGNVEGRYPFTKDVVYLKGLFAVHTFLRKAIADHRPELVERLFVGRLTLSDTLSLEDEFGSLINTPRYTPRWAAELPSLSAFLAFSVLVDQVDLASVNLEDVSRFGSA